MRKRAEEADLIEEKNERLRTVEEKLHSLKKKLEREVRAMNVWITFDYITIVYDRIHYEF